MTLIHRDEGLNPPSYLGDIVINSITFPLGLSSPHVYITVETFLEICGLENKNTQNSRSITNTTLRGDEVMLNQFPWLVGIYSMDMFCTAFLISDEWVMTSAHCVINRTVVVGHIVGRRINKWVIRWACELRLVQTYRIKHISLGCFLCIQKYTQLENSLSYCVLHRSERALRCAYLSLKARSDLRNLLRKTQ